MALAELRKRAFDTRAGSVVNGVILFALLSPGGQLFAGPDAGRAALERPPGLLLAAQGDTQDGGEPQSPAQATGTDTGSGADQGLDLPQAINFALLQNRNLALTRFDSQSAEIGIDNAEAEFRVSVTPEVALNTQDEGEASLLGLRVSRKLRYGTLLEARATSERFTGISGSQEGVLLEISQPLFRNAGKLVNEEGIIQAQSALAATRRSFQQQKIDLMLEVIRSYENILRLEQQLKADNQALKRASTLARSTRAKEALGRATRIDTLRVELQRGQAMSRLEAGREGLASAQQAFAELLGFPTSKRFDLQPTRLLQVKDAEIETALEIAYRNRLDYAQALQDQSDTQRGIAIARRGLLPDLSLVGRYERRDDEIVIEEGGPKIGRETWFLGVAGGTDLNRVLERNAVRQALVSDSASLQRLSTLELSIEREVKQAILAYRRAHAELKILQRNLSYADARLQLSRRLFELGRGDNFSVTDAEDAFLQAESSLLVGRSQASVAGYDLLRTIGTLMKVPEELKPQKW